jgi:hypothetical protein
VPDPNPLLTLARRLKVGRLLRYLDLWARYLWRRGVSALRPAAIPGKGGAAAEAAWLAAADLETAYRATVASWYPLYPLDLANAGLTRRLLTAMAEARPELGLSKEMIDVALQLRQADDLAGLVDRLTAAEIPFATINTALYLVLLRRLPAAAEGTMIASRHPRHALIAIRSGDEFARVGRRTLPA